MSVLTQYVEECRSLAVAVHMTIVGLDLGVGTPDCSRASNTGVLQGVQHWTAPRRPTLDCSRASNTGLLQGVQHWTAPRRPTLDCSKASNTGVLNRNKVVHRSNRITSLFTLRFQCSAMETSFRKFIPHVSNEPELYASV